MPSRTVTWRTCRTYQTVDFLNLFMQNDTFSITTNDTCMCLRNDTSVKKSTKLNVHLLNRRFVNFVLYDETNARVNSCYPQTYFHRLLYAINVDLQWHETYTLSSTADIIIFNISPTNKEMPYSHCFSQTNNSRELRHFAQ